MVPRAAAAPTIASPLPPQACVLPPASSPEAGSSNLLAPPSGLAEGAEGTPAHGDHSSLGQPAPSATVDRQQITDLFLELAQIDGGSRNERTVADTIKAHLAALGLSAVEDRAGKKIHGNTGNLIAELPGTVTDAPGLIFVAHMDTVDVVRHSHPQIRDGVIYGDGKTGLGADDRAGCAEILEMLRLIEQNNLPHPPIQVIFTVGEELGLLGSEQLDAKALHGKLGFAVDSFHPNDIFWGWDGPLFKSPDVRENALRHAQEVFSREARPDDLLEPRNHKDSLILGFTRDAIRGIGQVPNERSLYGASSDAASLRDKGIPAITIGAGEQDIHTPQEHVSQDDLQASTRLLLQIVEQANRYIVGADGQVRPRSMQAPAGWNLA
jgi:di/tripeptidase